MNKNPIKAIFFDLGNVIVGVDPAIAVKGYSVFAGGKEKALTDYMRYSDNLSRYQEGKLTSSQFYSKTRRYFKMAIDFNEFYRVWNSMFYPYPEVEKIIRSIKKTYPDIKMILLSDTNEAHHTFIKEQYDILGLLDDHVVSYEVGKQKPHPDMFKKALKAAGSIPKDTFYTDDRPELTDAARVMGIRAFQFTGHEQLTEQLAGCGICV